MVNVNQLVPQPNHPANYEAHGLSKEYPLNLKHSPCSKPSWKYGLAGRWSPTTQHPPASIASTANIHHQTTYGTYILLLLRLVVGLLGHVRTIHPRFPPIVTTIIANPHLPASMAAVSIMYYVGRINLRTFFSGMMHHRYFHEPRPYTPHHYFVSTQARLNYYSGYDAQVSRRNTKASREKLQARTTFDSRTCLQSLNTHHLLPNPISTPVLLLISTSAAPLKWASMSTSSDNFGTSSTNSLSL
ncbi:hypothetical protein BDQ12DRAFT_671001 [Crucibulum laeve]|uniref:Uncharacterized protein n=1 Tax=Crucibulum laeve TaxID=68775 RepID=A0A5C3LHF8_9AGAR|nr:hypothetical protein BDQ12DRAFT_671001 [Crucibulum laeve]